MGSIPGQLPISLRAWPSKDDKAVPLSSLILRINSERGSFREVTEEGLMEELRRDEAGVDINKGDSESEVEDVEEEPDRLKELIKAREEVLGQLEQAHNAAMVTLDFVSLLLSKDTPVQASLSISPALREAVALGTLGADKVQDSRAGKAQKDDSRRIAKGWKLQSLTNSVDAVLASAIRLEKEIEKETQYWEQVLTVSEKGWAICHLPQERHTLGVRFGFAESAPAFNNRSLGALRRNVDGTIYLDQGIADSTPKRVRIRIQTNGTTTGENYRSETIQNPAFIESSILLARNTIFEEELWQELNREARTLADQGVRVIGDEIVCGMAGNKRIMLDLQAAEDNELQQGIGGQDDDDTIAEIISLSLRLLLSYAHRKNHHRRSQPSPPISNRPPLHLPYNLLRPVIMRLHHEAMVCSLIGLLAPLSRALISTGACDSTHTMTTGSVISAMQAKAKSAKTPLPSSEQIIDALISHLSAEVTIPLTQSPFPSQALTIQLLTPLLTLETRFRISVSGPLATSCKPPSNPSTVNEVKGYILWAAACALSGVFMDTDKDLNDDGDLNKASQVNKTSRETLKEEQKPALGLSGWQPTHNPTVLRKSFKNEKDSEELAFRVLSVPREQHAVEIRASYKFVNGQQLLSRQNGAITHVWKSETANDATAQQNQEKQEYMSLRQFVENIGRWSQSSPDYGLGDDYERTSLD